jgi:hypothetical protein
MQQGTLNSDKTGITGTPATEQDWSLNQVGNWLSYQNKVSGTTTLDQSRTHSTVNEITALSSTPSWFTPPVYDGAGNLSGFPSASSAGTKQTGIYDAWNRLAEVDRSSSGSVGTSTSSSSSPSGPVAIFSYDGLNRRIIANVGYDIEYYFNSSWQMVEQKWDVPGSEPEDFESVIESISRSNKP